MKRRYVTELHYIGSGTFRVMLTCGHIQEVQGSVQRLPRVVPCSLCA